MIFNSSDSDTNVIRYGKGCFSKRVKDILVNCDLCSQLNNNSNKKNKISNKVIEIIRCSLKPVMFCRALKLSIYLILKGIEKNIIYRRSTCIFFSIGCILIMERKNDGVK